MARVPSNNIWIDTFHDLQVMELKERYGHQWILQFNYNLTNSLTQDERQKGWKVSQTNNHASFACWYCSHNWNSARVTVIFHYRLQRNKKGIVLIHPFGQKCRDCSSDGFMKPTFRETTAEKILSNLILKIRKNCYREDIGSDVPGPRQPALRTKPHEKELCEACMEGICNKDQEVS
ncbi:receptor-transporting protein 3-like [Rhinophrynus dorsalis]